MKICLITAFPPSGRQLNEYGLYLARELQRNPLVSLTILADKLTVMNGTRTRTANPSTGTSRGKCRDST